MPQRRKPAAGPEAVHEPEFEVEYAGQVRWPGQRVPVKITLVDDQDTGCDRGDRRSQRGLVQPYGLDPSTDRQAVLPVDVQIRVVDDRGRLAAAVDLGELIDTDAGHIDPRDHHPP